jgi:hypothetical protein
MWIKITGNKRANEPAKNAIAEDINERELDPLQDRINWTKKTDVKKQTKKVGTGRKHHEIQTGN